MPTRVLLEGPAIEPLLAQVRDEYGSSVRIISADKVRTGGFGGFFAKQHYELSVEVPDAEESATSARRPAAGLGAGGGLGGGGLGGGGLGASLGGGGLGGGGLGGGGLGGGPGGGAGGLGGGGRGASLGLGAGPGAARTADDGPQTLEQLLARAESDDRIAPDDAVDRAVGRDAGLGDAAAAVTGRPAGPGAPAERPLADPQSAFAELMANLDRAESNFNRAAPHFKTGEPERPDTPAVRPFQPARATGSPVNGGNHGGGVRPVPPAVPSLAELMGGLGVDDTPAVPHPAATRAAQNPAPPRSPAAAYGLAPTSPAPMATSLVEQLGGLGLDRPVSPAGAGPAPVPMTSLAHPSMPAMPQHWDSVQQNLMKVGMPPELAAQITGGDTYAGVLSVLATRPSAPSVPDAPGEILVLAGDLDHALPIGRKLCEQAGLDQSHLLLGGPSAAGTGLHSSRILGDPETAKTKVEKLQNADHAWIVLVDATVGRTDPIRIEDMCHALGATALWAVVDATRKTSDTARHLRALGDVEALVVHNVDITSDPATVLGLDFPIVALDGKPATPHSWAAMLCARIAADIVPMAALPRRARRG